MERETRKENGRLRGLGLRYKQHKGRCPHKEGEGKGRCVQTLAAENDSKNDAPAYNECNGDAGFLVRGATQTRHACPAAGILQGQSADQRQFRWRPLHVSGYKEGHLENSPWDYKCAETPS